MDKLKLINPLLTPDEDEQDPLIHDEYIDMSFFIDSQAIPLKPDHSILKLLIKSGDPQTPCLTSTPPPSNEDVEISKEIINVSEFPLEGSVVWVRFEGRKPNGELLDKSHSRFNRKKIKLFYDDFIEGLHISIQSMRKKEVSWFKIAPKYHYFNKMTEESLLNTIGDIGNEPLYYKIELFDFKNSEKTLENTDFEGRIKKFEDSRRMGNELFAKELYDKAYKLYRISIELLLRIPKTLKAILSDDQKEKLNYYASVFYGNSALCKIRQQKWYDGIKLINEGIRLYPLTTKVLLRKGLCLMKSGDSAKAEELIKEILLKEPLNKDANDLLKECQMKKNKENLLEKKMCKRVFEKWDDEEKLEILEKKRKKENNKKIENPENKQKKQRNLIEELKNGIILDMKDPCNGFINSENEEEDS